MDAVLTTPDQQPAVTRAARVYEPELDALRFCAFLAVFSFHTLPSDYSSYVPRLGHFIPTALLAFRDAMSYGVCVFFLLSSYLITKLLILEREATGSIHLKSFYVRRILRIWPLYIGFLLLMWLVSNRYLHVFAPIETGRVLAYLFFAGNIYTGKFGFTENPILPLWTVSIEEQFYIVWPLLARAGAGFLKRCAWLVVAVSVAVAYFLGYHSTNPTLSSWTSSLVQFQFFALGSLIAFHFARGLPTYSAALRVLMAAVGTALLLIAAGRFHVNVLPAQPAAELALGYELMALGVVLIFLAFLGAARGRRIPPGVAYLGKISYGLYVFHFFSLRVCQDFSNRFNIHMGVRTIGGAAITLALAMLSYRYFEKPFLLLKDRFAVVRSRAI